MLPETMLVQNFLVLFVLIGVAISRSASRSEAAVRLLGAWSIMLGLVLVGVWISPPPIAPWIYCVLLVLASSLHVLRSVGDERLRLLRLSHIPTFVSISLGALFLWQGLSGRLQPDIEVVNLAAPMQKADGICVLSGGNSLALNAHFLTAGSPLGLKEIHSVDFIKVRSGGFRTRSWQVAPQPKDIEEYLVYDEPVFAPCGGSVVEMKNDHPDHPAGGEYRDTSGVNFVTLRCNKADIILAHLRRGSIEVSIGQTLKTGNFIGTVGNSGNTEEPHLHIQAQTVLPPESSDGYPRPVAMTFSGRYLSRGECL
jgi:hypothetical protein